MFGRVGVVGWYLFFLFLEPHATGRRPVRGRVAAEESLLLINHSDF